MAHCVLTSAMRRTSASRSSTTHQTTWFAFSYEWKHQEDGRRGASCSPNVRILAMAVGRMSHLPIILHLKSTHCWHIH